MPSGPPPARLIAALATSRVDGHHDERLVARRRWPRLRNQGLVRTSTRRGVVALALPPVLQPTTRVGDGALDPLDRGQLGALLAELGQQRTPGGHSLLLSRPVRERVGRRGDLEHGRASRPLTDHRDLSAPRVHGTHPNAARGARQAKGVWPVGWCVHRPRAAQEQPLPGDPAVQVVQERAHPLDKRPALHRQKCDEEAAQCRSRREQDAGAGLGQQAQEQEDGTLGDQEELGEAHAEQERMTLSGTEHIGRLAVVDGGHRSAPVFELLGPAALGAPFASVIFRTGGAARIRGRLSPGGPPD